MGDEVVVILDVVMGLNGFRESCGPLTVISC